MAKVSFKPSTSKSKRHINLSDCQEGDIVFLENGSVFGIVTDTDYSEVEVTHFLNGAREWFDAGESCRKFVGEINFDINDFEEFI